MTSLAQVRRASTRERLALLPDTKDSILLVCGGAHVAYTVVDGCFYVHNAIGDGGSSFAALVQTVRSHAKEMGYPHLIFSVDLGGDLEPFVNWLVDHGKAVIYKQDTARNWVQMEV